jgi:hypothetical protein
VWECIPAIPAIGRQRQEDLKFEASLGYIAKGYLKKKKSNNPFLPLPLGLQNKIQSLYPVLHDRSLTATWPTGHLLMTLGTLLSPGPMHGPFHL